MVITLAGEPLPDPEVEPTISVDRTAGFLRVNRKTAYEGIRRGEIPSITIGRRVLVPTAALRAMLGLDSSAA